MLTLDQVGLAIDGGGGDVQGIKKALTLQGSRIGCGSGYWAPNLLGRCERAWG